MTYTQHAIYNVHVVTLIVKIHHTRSRVNSLHAYTCKTTSLRCQNFNTGEFLYLERYQIYKIHVHNASIMLLKQEFKFIKHQSRLCTYKKTPYESNCTWTCVLCRVSEDDHAVIGKSHSKQTTWFFFSAARKTTRICIWVLLGVDKKVDYFSLIFRRR